MQSIKPLKRKVAAHWFWVEKVKVSAKVKVTESAPICICIHLLVILTLCSQTAVWNLYNTSQNPVDYIDECSVFSKLILNCYDTIIISHWLYARPSCTIRQFWLYARQCKSIADERKLLYLWKQNGDLRGQWILFVRIKLRTRITVSVRVMFRVR